MSQLLAINGPLRRNLRRLPHAAVRAGLPPAALGYRWLDKTELTRGSAEAAGGSYKVLAPPRTERHALPVNVSSAEELPDDAGWWGYAFRDVPSRKSGETALVALPGATIAFARDGRGNFHPGLLAASNQAVHLREVDLRGHHAAGLRRLERTRLGRAVWIWERVYDNYSHWLSAHLPKLCLLRDLDLLGDLVLPDSRPAFIDESLQQFGVDPGKLPVVPSDRPLVAEELVLLVTDRFRPDLLRAAREAMALPGAAPDLKVYVSRRNAPTRRLLNEEEVWPLFEARGYVRVDMETLTFKEQRELMGRTTALAGPHGAGLTNQLFCPEGASVMEIADLGFPNPNFYALAAGLGHDYAVVRASSGGDGPKLFRHLEVVPERVEQALEALGR